MGAAKQGRLPAAACMRTARAALSIAAQRPCSRPGVRQGVGCALRYAVSHPSHPRRISRHRCAQIERTLGATPTTSMTSVPSRRSASTCLDSAPGEAEIEAGGRLGSRRFPVPFNGDGRRPRPLPHSQSAEGRHLRRHFPFASPVAPGWQPDACRRHGSGDRRAVRRSSDVDSLDSPPPMSRCARTSLGAADRTGDGRRALRCNAPCSASIRPDPAPGAALQRNA